ncbi:MFS transporter [Microbacterium sp.]|uniref:MFS transporter n=1 Tax=Microbacterium sp. TaxID=51671 RepID=UPI003567177B
MSGFQVMVVIICLLIVLAEGYDLLLMAFAASGVAAEWSLNGSQTGILLSAALIGMAFGSAFIAPLADRIGRRMQTLGCLALVVVTMALAAFSADYIQLGLCRLLTGLGIGGLVASLPVVAAEFSPKRRRSTMIAIYTSGLPLGGVVGGLIASALLANYSWRASFLVGAALTFALLVVVYFVMPESIDYLLVRRPKGALESINKTLGKMNLPAIDELPVHERKEEDRLGAAVFKGRNGVRTILLGAAFFFMMAAFYFATSWTPRLLEQSGFSAQQGISGGMLLNMGGAAAAFIISIFALRFKMRAISVIVFLGGAAVFVAMSLSLGNLGLALIFAVGVGAFTNGAASGLFALAPDCYPTAARTTGVGLVSAVGRIGAIFAPILAGLLIDLSWTPSSLFLLFAVPLVLGAIAVAAIRMPTASDPDTALSSDTRESASV